MNGGPWSHALLDALSAVQRRHALLLFVALGAALFAADHLLHAEQPIAVPPALADGNAQQWLEDEVLYREALARGLDEGDLIVRRRLVQKMRLLLETSVDVPEPDSAQLRDWIDQNAARYGGVARLSFDHVFLSRSRHGTRLHADADALRTQLASVAPSQLATLSDPHPGGTDQDGIDAHVLQRNFGTQLAETITGLPTGTWQGPFESSLGLHYVRIRSREARPPDYAAVQDRARRDYLIEQRRAATRLALDELGRSYGITRQWATP